MSGFTVMNPAAPRRAADPMIARIAEQVRRETAEGTPRQTGRLAAGWHVTRTGDGRYQVRNSVPYGRYVEYGTRHRHASAMLGRTLAGYRGRQAR